MCERGQSTLRQDKVILCGSLRQIWISKVATRVDHLIGCTIDDFATRTREIAGDVKSSSSSGLECEPSSRDVDGAL
jgi:hypothetical protein